MGFTYALSGDEVNGSWWNDNFKDNSLSARVKAMDPNRRKMFAALVVNIKPTQKTKIAQRSPNTLRCPMETQTLSPASRKVAKSAGYLCLL